MANVLVIGGGAAGLLAGIAAAQSGAQTVILEKMRRPGKKILITGKGRCNITNNCDLQEIIKNIPGNGRFLNSALRRFTNQDIVQLLEDNGLPTKVERGGRVFPVSDKAADVVDTLVKIYKNYGGRLLTDCKVKSITAEFGKITGRLQSKKHYGRIRQNNRRCNCRRAEICGRRRYSGGRRVILPGHRQRRQRRETCQSIGAHHCTAGAKLGSA